MKIYLARNHVQAGPYTLDELNRMLVSGEVVMSDLMWHKGMTNWQTVGQMTGGLPFYAPKITNEHPSSLQEGGFGDNVDVKQPKRTSVAELYGRNPENKPMDSVTVFLKKREHELKNQSETLQYANISSRVMAFLINLGLYLLALAPLLMAFGSVVDAHEIAKHSGDFNAMYAYSQSIANKLPQTTLMVSNLMLFGLLAIQLLLIIKRGQSFGKLVMGIRIVDETTGKLPSVGTNLFRALFLVSAYALASSLFSGLPAMIMLTVNYIRAKSDDKKQGWHDKLTKTLTVKANPIQLEKDKK